MNTSQVLEFCMCQYLSYFYGSTSRNILTLIHIDPFKGGVVYMIYISCIGGSSSTSNRYEDVDVGWQEPDSDYNLLL